MHVNAPSARVEHRLPCRSRHRIGERLDDRDRSFDLRGWAERRSARRSGVRRTTTSEAAGGDAAREPGAVRIEGLIY